MTTTLGAVLPLTTVFTPPANCLTSLTQPAPQDFGLRLGYDSTCIPSGAQTGERSYAFSPALNCPQSYTTVWSTSSTLGTVTENRAICCPILDRIEALSGLAFNYNTDTTGRSWYSTLGCTLAFPSRLALTVYDTGIPNVYGFAPWDGLNAYSVQIAWQSTDISKLSITSTISTTSTTSTTSTSTTPTFPLSTLSSSASPPTTTSTASPASDPLSTGSKIAIGVMVPLALIGWAIAALILMKYRRRRRSLNGQEHSNGRTNPSYGGPGILLREGFSVKGHESRESQF